MVKKYFTKAQMEIQQMAFMIIAVFIFFALVGLFFITIQVSRLNSNAAELEKEQAVSSIRVIADMPELIFDSGSSMTIDEDKVKVMVSNFGEKYENFWPVASVELYKIYPAFDEVIECPSSNCNYYNIFDNGQTNVQKYSSFISICSEQKSVQPRCDIGKLVVGVNT